MQKSKNRLVGLVGAGLLIAFFVLIVSIVNHYYPPLSNVLKYLGDPSAISEVTITENTTNVTVRLTDSEQIEEFCSIIESLAFSDGEIASNTAQNFEEKYYMAVTTATGHFIQTHLPRGRLFRGPKDKGFLSRNFEVDDMAMFDAWFVGKLYVK